MPTVVISFLVIYFLYVVGRVAIVPVFASFALAYLLNPIVQAGVKRGLSRTFSAIAAILLVSFAIGAFMTYVVPDLWAESTKAGQNIADKFTPENAARQREYLRRYSPALERVAGDKIEKFLSDPVTFYNDSMGTETTMDEEGKIVVKNGGSAIVETLVSSLDLLLVPFFVFYILVDFQRWRDSFESFNSASVSRSVQPSVRRIRAHSRILCARSASDRSNYGGLLRRRFLVSRRSGVGGHRAHRRSAQRRSVCRHDSRHFARRRIHSGGRRRSSGTLPPLWEFLLPCRRSKAII